MKKIAFTFIVLASLATSIAYGASYGLNGRSVDLEVSSSQFLSITDASQSGLDITGDLSISVWANHESFGWNAFVSKRSDTGNQRSYLFGQNSSVAIAVQLSSTGSDATNTNYTFDFSPTLGVWYHYVMVFTASSDPIVYVNGSLVVKNVDDTPPASLHDSTAPFRIGQGRDSDLIMDGMIDEVRIYNIALTADEVANLYSRNSQASPKRGSSLKGYWRLNNGSLILDESGNDNTLTNNNSALFVTDVPWAGNIPTGI